MNTLGVAITIVIVIAFGVAIELFADKSKPSDEEIAAQMMILMMWEDEYPEDY